MTAMSRGEASKHRGRKHLWIVGVDKGDLRATAIPAKAYPWSQVLNLRKLIDRTNRDRHVNFMLSGPFFTEHDAQAFVRLHHRLLWERFDSERERGGSLNPR